MHDDHAEAPPPASPPEASTTGESSDDEVGPDPSVAPVAPAVPRPSVGSPARQIGLGAIAFLATMGLLFGIASFVRSGPVGSTGSDPGGSGTQANASSAVTSPAPSDAGSSAGPNPVLVGAGDIADCDLDHDSATADLVAGIPGTVFTAGDNVYPGGTAAQFRDCYGPTWGRFLTRTRPAPGNHDHESTGLAGYRDYFGEAAAPDGTSWYSYEMGTWHVVVLDSSCDGVGGCGPDSDQGRWLAEDLAASTARCTLAIWHHPRWSSGEHGSDIVSAPFWRALYDAGADVVVNGHDHDYERFHPQDPDGRVDPARGIHQFVVGTGGAALRDFGEALPNTAVRAAIAHGVIRFVLQPVGYQWQFISTTGAFSDSGSRACH